MNGHKLVMRFESSCVRDDGRQLLDLFELIAFRISPWLVGNDRAHRWILSEPTSYAAARYSGNPSATCARVFCGAS
jgi:hypothetical protein